MSLLLHVPNTNKDNCGILEKEGEAEKRWFLTEIATTQIEWSKCAQFPEEGGD